MMITGVLVLVEKIKTTRQDPNLLCQHPQAAHMAQLKCYGYMVVKEKNLETIDLQLTYVHSLSKKTGEHKQTHTAQELTLFFDKIVSIYIAQLKTRAN